MVGFRKKNKENSGSLVEFQFYENIKEFRGKEILHQKLPGKTIC